MKTSWTIGQKIKHGPTYPLTCSDRFKETVVGEKNVRNNYPTPLALNGESYIIGLKRAIMSNFSYTSGYTSQGLEDVYPEHVRAYARGKFEECLLCVKTLKPFKPFLVRKSDVII